MMPSLFREAAALDRLTEFRRKFMPLVDKRKSDLRAIIDPSVGQDDNYMVRQALEEYDSLRHYERELHSLIAAFVREALVPWQKAYSDALALSAGPLRIVPGQSSGQGEKL